MSVQEPKLPPLFLLVLPIADRARAGDAGVVDGQFTAGGAGNSDPGGGVRLGEERGRGRQLGGTAAVAIGLVGVAGVAPEAGKILGRAAHRTLAGVVRRGVGLVNTSCRCGW